METSDRKTGHATTALHQHRSQQVHVSFATAFNYQQTCAKPTEVLLRKYFMPFGSLFDVAVKEYHVSADGRHQQGYAFLTFENASSASAVVKQGMFQLEDMELRCTVPLPHGHSPRDSRGYPSQPPVTTLDFNRIPTFSNSHSLSNTPREREEPSIPSLMNWLSPDFPLSGRESEREVLSSKTSFNTLAETFAFKTTTSNNNNNIGNNLFNANTFGNTNNFHDHRFSDYDEDNHARLRSQSIFSQSSFPFSTNSLGDISPRDSDKSVTSSGHWSICSEDPAVSSPYCPVVSLCL